MSKLTTSSPVLQLKNNKLSYDFTVVDTLTVGLKLTGPQVKAFAGNQFAIRGARIAIAAQDVLLIGMTVCGEIPTIVCLLTKKERDRMVGQVTQSGMTAMVEAIIMVRGKFKAVVAICKGKTQHDKREATKKADIDKQLRNTLKKLTK